MQVATNRKASFDFFIEETFEAGIKLIGNEVKTLRDGKFIIDRAWVDLLDDGPWLINSSIPPSINTDKWTKNFADRKRKLLFHKSEIRKLTNAVKFDNKTLIPLNCYFKNGKAKLTIAICKGKKNFDKRNSEKNQKLLE